MSKHFGAALAAFILFASASFTALADDHTYSEGPVVNVSSIRTVDGKFDDYMHWLSTTWKKMQEESKKKGYIVDYQVLGVEPRGPDDPDLYLIITYKNWAALDGALAKGDEISKASRGLRGRREPVPERSQQDPPGAGLADGTAAHSQVTNLSSRTNREGALASVQVRLRVGASVSPLLRELPKPSL